MEKYSKELRKRWKISLTCRFLFLFGRSFGHLCTHSLFQSKFFLPIMGPINAVLENSDNDKEICKTFCQTYGENTKISLFVMHFVLINHFSQCAPKIFNLDKKFHGLSCFWCIAHRCEMPLFSPGNFISWNHMENWFQSFRVLSYTTKDMCVCSNWDMFI